MSGNRFEEITDAGTKERRDNSLRGNAMRRAKTGDVPKTLTPWEWQAWYEEHGMPESFSENKVPRKTPWERCRSLLHKVLGR